MAPTPPPAPVLAVIVILIKRRRNPHLNLRKTGADHLGMCILLVWRGGGGRSDNDVGIQLGLFHQPISSRTPIFKIDLPKSLINTPRRVPVTEQAAPDQAIGDDNIGAQMLKKMGKIK